MILGILTVAAILDTVVAGCTVVVGPGILHAPEDVAWSERGGFWAADRGRARLHFFSPEGMHLRSFGSSGQGGMEFTDRVAVTDPGGQFIYVADTDGSRILKLTREGVAVREIRWPGEATAWEWKPRSLASRADGRVFVADERSGRVFVTDPFDGLRTLGDAQEGVASVLPAGLACTRDTLVMADQGTGVIRYLDFHGNELRRVVVDGAPGNMALRADGLVAVVDEESRTLRVVGNNGRVAVVATPCRLFYPSAVCVAPDGTLLVADRDGDCIIRLSVPGTL